jgi:hypothetical protein
VRGGCLPHTLKANEQLAAYAHETWAGWMKYLFGKSPRNADGSVWTRQMNTSYEDLPEGEKQSDRAEAIKIMRVFLGYEE